MVCSTAKKWASPVLAAYLVIAVMGCFTLLAIENSHRDELGGIRPGADVFFSTLEHSMEWLADDATKTDKQGGYTSAPPRELVFADRDGAARYRAEISPETIYKYRSPIAQNSLPLKLRI